MALFRNSQSWPRSCAAATPAEPSPGGANVGSHGLPTQDGVRKRLAEVFELSEYGRQLPMDEFRALFPH